MQSIEHFADLDVRLQKRHNQLVREHLGTLDVVVAGLRALPGEGTAFASTQAAWRFYGNEDVTLPLLAQPLVDAALASSRLECPDYALVLHDWTDLNFKDHSEKRDRIKVCSKGTLGYLVESSLLISSRTGLPVAPLSLTLWASDGRHTTRSAEVLPDGAQIDELTHAMAEVEGQLPDTTVVHVVDRGADSVDHYRQWERAERFFLVRADAKPGVVFEGETMSLGAVAERLQLRPSREVELSAGVWGQQLVAETVVRLERPAYPHRQRGGVKEKRKMIPGEAIDLRLVVSQVRAPDETVVGHWLLLTNVGLDVEAERIALWYYWRWKIESYYKLLKGAGHQVEHWRQETGEAIAKRMLVAAMACVVVWQLARSQAAEAEATRALLVRLSGRQMQRGKAFTEPALLAGLWVLLAMMDALEQYSLDELKQMARFVVPEFQPPRRNVTTARRTPSDTGPKDV